MGGEGSGTWYRFNKKTTIDECQRIDVRYLHREGLLKPGRWFSLRWSRAGRETGSIRGVVSRDDRPEQIILLYRHRSGASGEWEDVQKPVPLSWTACNFGGEAVVCLSGSWMWPEGSNPLRTWALLPVPPLLRPPLRKPARRQDAPGLEESTEDKRRPGRQREHDGAVPAGSPQGCT
jgi:hypothetical protein